MKKVSTSLTEAEFFTSETSVKDQTLWLLKNKLYFLQINLWGTGYCMTMLIDPRRIESQYWCDNLIRAKKTYGLVIFSGKNLIELNENPLYGHLKHQFSWL